MGTLIYGILLITFLVGYFIVKYFSNRVKVQCVEAGTTTGIDASELRKLSHWKRIVPLFGPDGEYLDPKKYIRLKIKGSCMTPKQINDGDTVIAEKINRNEDCHSVLKEGDVVWFHIKETGMDKIRVFQKWAENDEMETFYFKDGQKHFSSSHHRISQICGIVRYIV